MKTYTREEIIAAARKQDPKMGDAATIAAGEWGYWVGCTIYVSKQDVEKLTNLKPERSALAAKGG